MSLKPRCRLVIILMAQNQVTQNQVTMGVV
jgi:hypothetical protein